MKAIMQNNIKKISRYGYFGPMVFSVIVLLAFLLVPSTKGVEALNIRTLTLKFDEAQTSVTLKEDSSFIGSSKAPRIKVKSSKNIDDYTLQPNKLKEFTSFYVATPVSFDFLSFSRPIFSDNFSLSSQPTTYSDGESHSLSTTVFRFILYNTIKAYIA